MLNIARDGEPTLDSLEQELLACETLIATLPRRQAQLLAALDESNLNVGAGSRTMIEWVSARLDIDLETARLLMRAAGVLSEHPDLDTRLQPHHAAPRSKVGSHDPANLATLCWYHHHVAIHGLGSRLDPDSPTGRMRLLPPEVGPDPPTD